MPFTPPSRAEILARVKADMRVELGLDPLRRSVEYALARAVTGQAKGAYGYQAWLDRQHWPDLAEDFYFWRWAALRGVYQKNATGWQGIVRFTGVNGTLVPPGAQIARSDGYLYEAAAGGTIAGGIADLEMISVSVGSITNNEDSNLIPLSVPIPNVDSTVEVQSTTHTGTDAETREEGLVRLLLEMQTPPSGGGPGDYVRWALEVAGVTRAWEFANLEGPNSVSVAFVRDNDGTGAAIVPDSTERDEVLAHLLSVAPITVDVRVIALVAQTVDVQISALVPDTSTVQDAIELSLEDFFVREGAPGQTLALSRIDAAVSEADGEISHVLDTPAASVVSTTAQIPILGTVTVV